MLWKVNFRKTVLGPLAAGLLPLYFFLSFSGPVCSLHQHPQEIHSKHSHHASSSPHQQDKSSGNSGDFCKYSQCSSADSSIVSVRHIIPLQVSFYAFHPFTSLFLQEELRENALRGPPYIINL